MDTDTTTRFVTTRRRRRLLAAIAGLALASLGGSAAASGDLPTYDQCRLIDHHAAVDLGPLLATGHEPSIDVRSVLLGERQVGTDCSIFDLPADQPV